MVKGRLVFQAPSESVAHTHGTTSPRKLELSPGTVAAISSNSFLAEGHPDNAFFTELKEAHRWLNRRLRLASRPLAHTALRTAWERVLCGTYPTRYRLARAGLLESALCPECAANGICLEEDCDHVLCACPSVKAMREEVWDHIVVGFNDYPPM